jgi:hypothetical protein
LLGPTLGVSETDTTQKGLGFILEDLATPDKFSYIINPAFLARIVVALLLGGLTNLAPANVTNDSLIGYFDGTMIGKENFERILRYDC